MTQTLSPRGFDSDDNNTQHLFGDLWVLRASLIAQLVKNLPAMQKTPVQFLGQEDPLEKGLATHSSILAWRIPWIKEPDGIQYIGLQRVEHN